MSARKPAGPAHVPSPLEPFWASTTMLQESMLFISPAPGQAAEAQLLFIPTAMPRLQSCTGQTTYEPDRDFIWRPGTRTIAIPPGSCVPVMAEVQLYPPRGSQKHGTCRDRECDLLFAAGPEFHHQQIAATYPHALDGWRTPGTLQESSGLPNLVRRLARGRAADPLRIVLLGDSISVGMNASGLYGVPPGNPGYGPLVAEAIGTRFDVEVAFTNLSVGGKDSAWGIERMDAVIAARPDLLLIAFGMNDASARRSPEQFGVNLRRHLELLGQALPQAECLLVAPMTGHPQWTGTDMAAYPRYRDQLLALRRPGVTAADVTSVWMSLLERKKYVDLTGNGLNHPNDFGHRIYAQALWWVLRQALRIA